MVGGRRESFHSHNKSCKKIYSLRNGVRGTGKIVYAWQRSSGTLMASAVEGNPVVFIHNRQGHIQQQISIQGNCTALAWDEDGDFLAIVTEGSSVILFWESHSKRLTEIDSNIKDPGTCLAWSKAGKIFAYCTSKGNLLVYNHRTMRKVPIIGKHAKKIICCAWSNDNCLGLGTLDNLMSVNTIDGDAIKTIQLRGKPHDMKFGQLKEDHASSGGLDNTISVIVGEKTLYLLRLEDQAQAAPLELGFQQRYGNLVAHHWHGDGYILASFSSGFIVTISTHHREIGTELLLIELEADPLRWTAMCDRTSQICICFGDTQVEIRSTTDPNQIACVADIEDEGRLRPATSCQFSDDGQLLGVVTIAGDLHVFLTSVPLLGASTDHFVIQMSSLTEVIIHTLFPQQESINSYVLALDIEPSFVSMGPCHIAVTLNNRVWFYSTTDLLSDPAVDRPVCVKEYNSNVIAVCLNAEYAATMSGDKVYLHFIDGDLEIENREVKVFQEPNTKQSSKITCHCMTKEFLVFGTDAGILRFFHILTWEEINHVTVKAKSKLKSINPDLSECKYVIFDRDGLAFLFDMRSDTVAPITSFPSRVDVVLWDRDDLSKEIFITYSLGTQKIDVFIVWKDIIAGQGIHHVETIRVFSSVDNLPVLLQDGVIYSQTSTGRLGKTMNIYTDRPEFSSSSAQAHEAKLSWLIGLRKYRDAFDVCEMNKLSTESWIKLGKAAAINLDLEIAIKAYNRLGNYATAFNLAEVLDEDDLKLACGHIALNISDFDLAEKCYLLSSEKEWALSMRCDLHQWEDALGLAMSHAPYLCAGICLKYAESEEDLNNWPNALLLYEKAKEYAQGFEEWKDVEKADSGIARNSLRCGHIQRGMEIVSVSTNIPLKLECAEILENTKFLSDAAILFEGAGEFDRAASLYIRNKQWDRVAAILPGIHSNKIHLQYAKAKEIEGSYAEAAEVYEESEDLSSACRLYLKSGNIDDAIRVAKEAHRPDISVLVAEYLDQKQDLVTGIQFLLRSECYEDAVKLAFKYGKYELLADLSMAYVEDEAPNGIMPIPIIEGIAQAGAYFESLKDHFKAGKYHFMAGDPDKAYRILMKATMSGMISNEEEFMNLLIKVTLELCRLRKSSDARRELVEYLLGERDGYPKDLKYILEFYARGKYTVEAAKTCLIYCKDELRIGNVDNAQKMYLQTIKNLRDQSRRTIPNPLYQGLKVVHFLKIAKLHSTFGNNEMAARLFKTVYNYYEDFPQQAIGILTSTIIENYKCGLKDTAIAACYIIMKPEYRRELAPEFKEKFEFIVRKYGKSKTEAVDIDDLISACPNCSADLPNYDLHCKICTTEIPYCIVSGRHILADDFAYCPYCEFPVIKSEFIRMFDLMYRSSNDRDVACPMCQTSLSVKDFEDEYNIEDYLNNKWIDVNNDLLKSNDAVPDADISIDKNTVR